MSNRPDGRAMMTARPLSACLSLPHRGDMTQSPPAATGRDRPTRRTLVLLAMVAIVTAAACSESGTVTNETDGASHTTIVDDSAIAAPAVDASAYAVFDTQASTMLATTNADARLSVGSLMKLLNAIVAYDAGHQDKEIVAPDRLAGSDGESVIGIGARQVVSRSLLIRAMLKVSANDAARLLAIDIAGSEDAYATMMNDAASSLGLTNTRAVNATGLDAEGQFSSARDLILLARVLSVNDDFRQTVRETTAQFNGQTIPNTNDLLVTYPGADGIKTGHTGNAGYCLLASATRNGRRVIVAVLGAPTDDARDQAAVTLLDWAFTQDPPQG
jgi:D-alanyl-D-alanine carboxypeptidase (penicillin-binding protein 5/6)